MIKPQISKNLSAIIDEYLKDKNIDDKISWTLEIPPKNIDADFALNAAMLIAKQIKNNPQKIASELIEIIKTKMADIVGSAFIAGAGFINIRLKDAVLFEQLKTILKQKDKYGQGIACEKEKVLLEFVSANPTGPLHIGHGRGAAIGDSLARIFDRLGHDVIKEYYLNDAGNQMLILAKSLEVRYLQQKGEKIDLPKDHYQGEYINAIAQRLIDEGKNFDEIDFKSEAVKDILKSIKDDLKDFGVEFDEWFSESTIAVEKDKNGLTQVDKVCRFLEDENQAYVNEGALWLSSTRFGDDKDRVLRRSDGRYTYLASDAAYHKNKFERADRLINLLGADHHGYQARLKALTQMLGRNADDLEIILYQLVSLVRDGKPAAMSTRSGEFVSLKEVMDEVGADACRFFFLLRAPDSQLDFDLELAKKQSSENPVFYVQYVGVRCASIIKESAKREDLIDKPDFSLLKLKEERDLLKKLTAFCDVLLVCGQNLSPHYFTTYLIELADLYHRFYEKARVLSDDSALTSARLKLVEAVLIIIENSLGLLAIDIPEKM
jgi:arginyl-tRNA synthetase